LPVSAVVFTPALTELERRVNVVGVVEDVTDRSYPVGKEAKLEVDVAYSLRSRTPRRLLLHELGKQ